MGKRTTKAEALVITLFLIVGLPIYFVSQLGKLLGWEVLIGIVISIILLFILHKTAQREKRYEQRKKRYEQLMAKYQNEYLVDRLMGQCFWQGQTSEQLFDSLGPPQDVDEKVLKTKKKEVWKYCHQGGNRFRLRITLDNDVVVGWDDKR